MLLSFFYRLETYGWPILLLVMRLWMAHIFWRSGRVKFIHFESTRRLFKFEYKVPYINPDLAAYLTTTFELMCPVLLVLGFIARLATIPLLTITAVIQFTYLNHTDHFYWAVLLSTLLFKGAGPLSIDALICKRS